MVQTIGTSERKLSPITRGNYKYQGSPYIGIATGTAQVNKLMSVIECFGDVGLKNRFQSAIFYDINADTLLRIRKRSRSAGMFGQRDMQSLFPKYIPTDTGWNRDPYSWKKWAGGLIRDQEALCTAIKDRSEELESQPQMILFFTGFGSHGLLGIELYKKVRKQFPNTLVLTVLTIPKEPMIRKQALRIWDEYSQFITDAESAGAVLLVDDSMASDLKTNDHKLAVLLAAIEQSGANDTKSGTLVDVVNGLKFYSEGSWFGANVSHPAVLPSKRKFHAFPPFFRTELVEGKSQDLQRIASEAISDIEQSVWQLAKHGSASKKSLRKTFCALPISKDYMGYLTSQVHTWFSSKKDADELEYLSVDYAAANFPYISEGSGSNQQLPNKRSMLGQALNLFMIPITGSLSILKWAAGRHQRFYCHVGQIYVLSESERSFTEIPSINDLLRSKETIRGSAGTINSDSHRRLAGRDQDISPIERDQHIPDTAFVAGQINECIKTGG